MQILIWTYAYLASYSINIGGYGPLRILLWAHAYLARHVSTETGLCVDMQVLTRVYGPKRFALAVQVLT